VGEHALAAADVEDRLRRGLREQLHAILLQPLGVTREAAVAISLLTFAHLLVSSLLGVFFWLQLPAAMKSHIPTSESEIPLDAEITVDS